MLYMTNKVPDLPILLHRVHININPCHAELECAVNRAHLQIPTIVANVANSMMDSHDRGGHVASLVKFRPVV